ncbi:MAG: helix-turn-helix transcriptional regulator [Treponema sp.]|nr:helix-turn-helix transcriptional regulator [Treponema sp.]
MTDILEEIRKLKLARKWSEYQLAERSGIPQSTISSWYRKNQIPTIPSLEKICAAFNITLAQFFSDKNAKFQSLTEEQQELLNEFGKLQKDQQQAILNLLKTL